MDGSRRLRLALPIVVGVVVVDQLTKWWALEELGDGSSIEILPTLELQLARNSGFSFSTGSGNGQIIGALVLGLSAVMVGVIFRAMTTQRVVLVAFILGGAIGNLLDRLFRATDGVLSGEVIDFIDVSWYAVFNIADAAVVCAAIALVVLEWRADRNAVTDPSVGGEPLDA